MINYQITGSLPTIWEDFYTLDKSGVNVTISAGHKNEDIKFPNKDDWFDLEIMEKELTYEKAKELLSFLNDNKEVEIKQMNIVQAI